MAITYKDAGVDITAGNVAVEKMKQHVKKTFRPEVLTDLGSFAGLFALDNKKYKEPVLVAGTDGVGTKLRVAMLLDKHITIGIDAVAMCVNDILVQGAEPLFFLDYIAVGKLDPDRVASIVEGISEGCLQSNCALIGGETAEMPGFYGEEEYDIAGFAVGVADKDKIITGKDIKDGDIILGLPSTGLHSNGYSLARKVLLELSDYNIDTYVEELGETVGEAMLTPTKIYAKEILPLLKEVKVKGMCHITGGGLLENVPRILPEKLKIELDSATWQVPAIFDLMKKIGNIAEEEMFRVFNMGIGFALFVKPEDVKKAMTICPDAIEIGKVYKKANDDENIVNII